MSVDPGEGYILLAEGDIQQPPDEFFSRRRQAWTPVCNVGLPVQRGELVRRAVLAEIERLKAELEAVKQTQPEPAEDPDEWVTQDRDYKRPCDQRRWVDVNSGIVLHDWDDCYMVGHHGYTQGNMRLELRCKRRDLPPMPEQKLKTETIVFHEVMIRDNLDGQPSSWHLSWMSEVPDSEYFIKTGRTETREVVR